MTPRILIVGAGEAGRELAQELARLAVRPQLVCFVDDNPSKYGTEIDGIPVLGPVHELGNLIRLHTVDEVIVSAPSASGELVRRVIAACRETQVRFRIVPRLAEIIGGHVRWDQITDVRTEDLLGRTVVRQDLEDARKRLTGKRVLVTGAAGSIGSELTRQLLLCSAELILVDCNENGMFLLREELRDLGDISKISFEIASVRDDAKMRRLFAKHRPSVVFHAAAYKHVPLMEEHPDEAVLNNVDGTRRVTELALEYKCEDFVMVSTDKAVNPTSVMGCTKRVAEKIVQSMAKRNETKFVAVRFGNVLGSAGSVIPVFKKQIEKGGPITVTHADMVRYFMTIPEAAQLIIQAWALGDNGQIFVLDMGEPVRIVELAEQMIRLLGYEPGTGIKIEFSGLRPGEKLYEELLTASEKVNSTRHEKIFVTREEEQFDTSQLLHDVEDLTSTARRGELTEIVQKLRRLVPTFQA